MEHFDFPLREETLKAIADMGYEAPTPIQEMTIPPLLEGRDVIGQAQTGTGKTVAFGIPMIERVDESAPNVQGLVLSPTRELAMQTAGEIAKLAKYRPGLSVLAVYGGQPIERQLLPLKRGVQIVVGTPGRVLDHLNRGTLHLADVQFAVLDEADEMLDMGFRDDIETILSQTAPSRQTALFSATMPFPIMSLAQKYLKEPTHLRVENQGMTVEAVKQTYIPIRSFHKVELLSRLLVRDHIARALVFMNTKLGVEEVVTRLQARGFAAAGLHGDMRQIERDAIMERFKKGTVGILVATDVAARGLDIENVEAVFNYDIPLDVENYVHRVGRTGRAGKEGRAYTFVVGRETSRMWDYRKITKAAILCEQPPSGDDIRAAEEERLLATARDKADAEQNEHLMETARKLLETTPAEKTVAALMELLETAMGDKIAPEIDLVIPQPPKPAPRPAPARPVSDRRPGRRDDSRGPRRFGRPAEDNPHSGERRYGRPAPDTSAGDRRYGRPVPDASADERRYGQPSPDTSASERRYGRPVPDASADERRYGRPVPDASASECHYGRPVPDASADERRYGRPVPDASASERRYGRPVPDASADERRYDRPVSGASDVDNRAADSDRDDAQPKNRYERRRREFGEPSEGEAQANKDDTRPKNRYERRRREFGELSEGEAQANKDVTQPKNRYERRRREFGEPSEGEAQANKDDTQPKNRYERRRREFGELSEGEAQVGGEALHMKPYRPWDNSARRSHGRDGAVNAKDRLTAPRKPRRG